MLIGVEVVFPIRSKCYRVYLPMMTNRSSNALSFVRIGWKWFALFFLQYFIFVYIYVDYSLFPIEFEDGTVKSKRSTYTRECTCCFHNNTSQTKVIESIESTKWAGSSCILYMCVITRHSLCMCRCVRVIDTQFI